MARKKKIEHDQIVKAFAERLREHRRRMGMSQHSLATTANVNVGYLGKLERAEAAPGLDMVGRLAHALGIAPTELIAIDGTPTGLNTLKTQVKRKVDQILSREDMPALQSLSVLLGLVDNALARRNVAE